MASLPLQAMDLTSLRAVLAELRPLLLPTRFEKAQQSDPHTVQLGMRGLEGRLWLELSWLAEAPRLLAIAPPPRSGEGSTLAQQLQHGLSGLALVALQQEGWERVVELGFALRPGEAIQRTLVLELMGRHSNLFLLDEQRRVVAAGRQVRQQHSRLRPIGTGDPYGPPPALSGSAPDPAETFAHWQGQLLLLPVPLQQALQSAYQGISPALALQLASVAAPETAAELLRTPVGELQEQQWRQLWNGWQCWLATLSNEQFVFSSGGSSAYSCWSAQPREQTQADRQPLAINGALAQYHRSILLNRQLLQRQHQLQQRLQQALLREQAQHQHQQQLLDQVEGSEQLQRQADALLCLPNPSREQIQNAQALYQRARKLRRSVAAITPRLEQHRQRIAELEASLTYLEQWCGGEGAGAQSTCQDEQVEQVVARMLANLQALEHDSAELLLPARRGRGRVAPRQATASSAAQPTPLELHSPGGLRIQVGRNHRQNEWISLRQARRGDLWFHAQECPGSHVVLKASEAIAAEADLQAAADLAAHFSRARANGRVAVLMVPCQQLQRIAGAGPGTVRHRGGEVLWGQPLQAANLLNRSAPSLNGEPEP